MQSRKLLRGASVVAPLLMLGLAATPIAGAQTPPPTPPPAATGPLTPAEASTLARGVTHRVIVVLKDQATSLPATAGLARVRARAVGRDQGPVLAELATTGAQNVHPYTTLNAVSATVSAGEQARLQANPAVAQVVPDQIIHLVSPATAASQAAAAGGVTPLPGACAPRGQVQLDPQALQTIHANSQTSPDTARALGFTGAGTTVAFIADGLDTHIPDFTRNGHSVFVDYKDFSGEGTATPTGGGEAFLDAGSIAAQGHSVYDVSHYSSLPLNRPCPIRVVGVAPGANLVGLDIFGNEDAGYNSIFLQAIDYAVSVDHVNVLNESLGSNNYPDDSASLNLIKAANDMAEAAGTTVVVSSGDAGSTSTIGTPATDPAVISTGATTTYRLDAQDGYGGSRFAGVTGWLDNNISSLSSGGFTQDGSTVDLVAPGELNWAPCSTAKTAKGALRYSECVNLAGKPSAVQASGGTSESAPLTSGVAALVIQAYRSTHHNASPIPAAIKQILTSTADDIAAPADQQGAGLVDAYQAVLAAESYQAAPKGGTLLTSSGQFNAVAATATPEHFTETVTNNGAATQHVAVATRAVGSYQPVKTATVTLADTSPHTTDWNGVTDNVETVPFTVPPGQSRLDAAIAFQGPPPGTDPALHGRVRLSLVDSHGRLAAYSVPQGDGNYGDVQVANPASGPWTAYVYSRDSKDGGTTGPVVFGARAATFATFGTVSPSSLTLAPGQSAPVTLAVATPSAPGDGAGAIVLSADGGPTFAAATTVPVTLRSLVPPGPTTFGGVLTGGNGRQVNLGQSNDYQTDVPAGARELNATVTLADNPNNQFNAFLVSPAGEALAFAGNDLVGTNAGGLASTNTLGSQLHVLNPAAGRWTLIIEFAPQVSGAALSEPFTVTMDTSAVPAAAPTLPDSAGTTLAAGTPTTVNVTITNHGTSPEAYFVDARRSTTSQYHLAAVTGADTTVPLSIRSTLPIYLVPPDTTAITGAAVTSGPNAIRFDMESANGDPDIASNQGKQVGATLAANPVSQGAWDIAPDVVGPFGPAPAPNQPVSTALLATTNTFDPTVTSPTGDLWYDSVDPTAIFDTYLVQPGQSATIPVTITPSGAPGTVTSGTLYVDDASLVDFGTFVANGNQVAALPYTYTIK